MGIARYSEALTKIAEKKLTNIFQKLISVTNVIDEILGTSMIRKCHNDVKTCEFEFTNLRSKIEDIKIKIQNSSTSIDDVRRLLDRSDRTSNDYLKHLTEERSLLIEHRKLLNGLEEAESQERSCFNKYSLVVRNFYEMERVQSDQMRFYSVCFSVFCTILGLIGSTILFKFREKRHKEDLDLIKKVAITPEVFQSQFLDAFNNNMNLVEKRLSQIITCQSQKNINNNIEKQISYKVEPLLSKNFKDWLNDDRFVYLSMFIVGGIASNIVVELFFKLF